MSGMLGDFCLAIDPQALRRTRWSGSRRWDGIFTGGFWLAVFVRPWVFWAKRGWLCCFFVMVTAYKVRTSLEATWSLVSSIKLGIEASDTLIASLFLFLTDSPKSQVNWRWKDCMAGCFFLLKIQEKILLVVNHTTEVEMTRLFKQREEASKSLRSSGRSVPTCILYTCVQTEYINVQKLQICKKMQRINNTQVFKGVCNDAPSLPKRSFPFQISFVQAHLFRWQCWMQLPNTLTAMMRCFCP